MSLPGKALHVAIEIWHCVELAESNMLSISMSRMAKIGISRFAASRGLTALEKAGLVSVIRHVGQKPIVTVLVSLAEPKSEAP
jgi:DNA-binding transcriptional ArsR family regulator